MTFDPRRRIDHLQQSTIKYYQGVDFAKSSAINCLDSFGIGILNGGIECLLVGLTTPGRELLVKSRGFLRASIDNHEIGPRYGRGVSESLRLSAHALALWLAGGEHDSTGLKEAVRWQELWFDNEGSEKSNVDFSLADYLDAEEYAILTRRFEIAQLRKPNSLRQVRGEGAMAYVIARQRLGLEYSADEVATGLTNFLKRKVPRWLGSEGNFEGTARWMKIAHWQPGDDPVATLLKCYDYLPGVEQPSTAAE